MEAKMTLTLSGVVKYDLDNGPLYQAFALVNDSDSQGVRGYLPAKMSISAEAYAQLPVNLAEYPLTAEFLVHNKIAGGKLTQSIRGVVTPAKPKAS